MRRATIYEAPLHVKALGGCFIIDDFGRQLVSPTNLLNRWIVPLESRVDYLKLHTGKSFSIPFEELVMFSTNLEPEDLMDPAFLRRLPYKIEIGSPSLDIYRRIFDKGVRAPGHGRCTEEIFDVHRAEDQREKRGSNLAAFQPQVHCGSGGGDVPIHGADAHFEPRYHRLCARQPAGATQFRPSAPAGLLPEMQDRPGRLPFGLRRGWTVGSCALRRARQISG